MADFIINGTTYSGSPIDTSHPQRPSGLKRTTTKIGRTFTAANGDTSFVARGSGIVKHKWVLSWEKANATTQAALKALYALTTTFAFVDQDGTSYTVLCTGDDPFDEDISSNRANAYLYNVDFTLKEA